MYASYTMLKVVLLCRLGQQLVFFFFKFLQNFYVKTLRTCVPGSGSSTWRAPLRAQVTLGANFKSKSCIKISIFLTVSSQFYHNENHECVPSALRELHYGPKWWRNQDRKNTTRADRIQISWKFVEKLLLFKKKSLAIYAGQKIFLRKRASNKMPKCIKHQVLIIRQVN